MTYSCAIFEDLDGDLRNSTSNRGIWNGGQGLQRLGTQLENKTETTPFSAATINNQGASQELYLAQLRKLHHIIRKARVLPGQRILEIGSGWGAMAILIAHTIPGTTIDTITLSVQQQSLAQDRIHAAGLSQRITVHLMDYRNMPPHWEGVFDRVISIEMIEAVGAEFLEKYWNIVDWAMKKRSGVGVVQVITIPEPSKCATLDNIIKVYGSRRV
jgi:cyclopropane-fatty-acyl-phospholipid synthase